MRLTAAEIETKVSIVAAGHKMAGFNVTEEDREAGRAIIAGELDAADEVARLVAEAKTANANPPALPSQRSTTDSSTPTSRPRRGTGPHR